MITVVLDDDPTGTQAVADVPVGRWTGTSAGAWDAVLADDRAVHVLNELTRARRFQGRTAGRLRGSGQHARAPPRSIRTARRSTPARAPVGGIQRTAVHGCA